jgi:thymidylate kinase
MNHYDDHGVGDLKARLAELEALVHIERGKRDKWQARAIAAETELARVADLRKRWEALLSAARGLSVVDAASDIDDITNTIEDILSDTPTEEE